jgi:hypothetical protein
MNKKTPTYHFCKSNSTSQDVVTLYCSDNNPGSSYDNPITIEATSSRAGVAAEYVYLKEHYGARDVQSQSLAYHGERYYDIFEITLHSGITHKLYFDITSFHGRYDYDGSLEGADTDINLDSLDTLNDTL